jgi:large subunit ribosomal protein L30
MALKLKLTLVRSGVNRPADQKATIRGLGLTRMNKTVILNDTAAIRGMIRKVSHLVKVEAAE